MTTIEPHGEEIRRAVKWLQEMRKTEHDKALAKLIEEACVKFDLSPMDAEFLARYAKDEKL